MDHSQLNSSTHDRTASPTTKRKNRQNKITCWLSYSKLLRQIQPIFLDIEKRRTTSRLRSIKHQKIDKRILKQDRQ